MSTMTKEEKVMQALELLAFGGTEVKEVIQYERVGNGRDAVRGKTVTKTAKLPDRSSLFKYMEINDIYVDAQVQLRRAKVAETEDEQADDDLLEGLDLNG